MISTCTTCGNLYDYPSEEAANEPDRECRTCYFGKFALSSDEEIVAILRCGDYRPQKRDLLHLANRIEGLLKYRRYAEAVRAVRCEF